MVANASPHAPRTNTFRRGFGIDKIKSDMALGSAASLLIHGSILLAALWAWQVTPRIMPEDVIAVDMVSDTPSVIGKNSAAESAQTGVDTPTPSPLPQTLPPSPPEPMPTLAGTPPLTQTIPSPKTAARPQPQPQPSPPSLPPPPAVLPPTPSPAATSQRLAPTPRPLPAPQPVPKPVPKAAPKAIAKAAPPARTGQRQGASTAPVEFDLAAASNAATGADSGGRRAPQLASRGQAGRLGKAGGGAALTGDLEAALRAQIQPCWLEPANMSESARLLVVVSIDLGVDGRLLRDPVLVTPSSRAGANPSLVVAIDNALRAVRECAPFTLPPDRYESWRQVRFNFDPQRMARRQ